MTNKIRFVTAVLSVIREIRGAPFSIGDATEFLQKQLNAGDLVFTDKKTNINSGLPYKVRHEEVEEVFLELLDNDIISGFAIVDTDDNVILNDISVSQFSDDCYFERLINGWKQSLNQGLQAIKESTNQKNNPKRTVSIEQIVNNEELLSHDEFMLRNKVQDYLAKRVGVVTMKEIQSRFKGVPKTCCMFAELVSEIGFLVNKSSQHPSKWTITV